MEAARPACPERDVRRTAAMRSAGPARAGEGRLLRAMQSEENVILLHGTADCSHLHLDALVLSRHRGCRDAALHAWQAGTQHAAAQSLEQRVLGRRAARA